MEKDFRGPRSSFFGKELPHDVGSIPPPHNVEREDVCRICIPPIQPTVGHS